MERRTTFLTLTVEDERGESISSSSTSWGSVIPVLLGDGVRFFDRIDALKRLTLVEAKSFPSGIVSLNYRL